MDGLFGSHPSLTHGFDRRKFEVEILTSPCCLCVHLGWLLHRSLCFIIRSKVDEFMLLFHWK